MVRMLDYFTKEELAKFKERMKVLDAFLTKVWVDKKIIYKNKYASNRIFKKST